MPLLPRSEDEDQEEELEESPRPRSFFDLDVDLEEDDENAIAFLDDAGIGLNLASPLLPSIFELDSCKAKTGSVELAVQT
jgi:hypothetical protein